MAKKKKNRPLHESIEIKQQKMRQVVMPLSIKEPVKRVVVRTVTIPKKESL